MVTRSAAVGADVRLEYVETGDPNGLPVVFLHGVTDSWTSFEGTMERLPESIRAIAVSQRGHGNSSRPAAGYSMEYFSRDVRHFMDALELPAAVIVGHSMGGFVAQRFAAELPDRT
jgi:pimeloyl-ACP methyl ester carboxylesterase